MATDGGIPQRASRATTRRSAAAARTNIGEYKISSIAASLNTTPDLYLSAQRRSVSGAYAEDAAASSIRCAAADGDVRRAALRRAIRLAATAISSGSWLKRAVCAAGRAGGRVGVRAVLVGGIGMGRFGGC